MVYTKTVAVIAALFLIAVFGSCSCSSVNAPKDRFEDERTGKTYSDTTELLEERKADNPNEFRVVSEIAKDEPSALVAYGKAFETEGKIDKPAPPLYFDENGQEIKKEDFIKKVSEKAGEGFEQVAQDYYKFLSESKFKEAFDLVSPKGSFSKVFFGSFDTYKTQQDSLRSTTRFVEAFVTDYKLTPQNYPDYTIDVYFKVLGFFRNQPEIKEPGKPGLPDDSAANTPPKKTPEQAKEEMEKLGWDFRYSGVSKFTLAFVGGKWLIHD